MRLKHGMRARFNLIDGTTVEGTVVRPRCWSAVELVRVQVLAGDLSPEAAGRFLIPRKSVVFAQVLHVEVAIEEDGN